jgi:hypothetical protein
MPQVSSGNQELINQILTIAQILGRRKDVQAKNVLDLAKPGQTAGEIGLTPSLSKRAFGREYQPGEIVVQDTAQAANDRAELAFLDAVKNNPAALENAKPGDLLSLGASIFANKQGTPGMSTPGALKTRAATSEVAAGTEQTKAKTQGAISKSVFDRVQDGIKAMDLAPQEARSALGQNLAYGTTTSALMADDMKARLAAEATKRGIQFVADPQNHPLGAEFRKLGVDPVAAVAAIGTGSLGFLDNVARLSLIHAESNAAYGSALRAAQAKWATGLSESMGGKLSPQTIIAVMDRRMEGKPPLTGSGATAERLIDNGMEMAYRAAVAKATAEGDPTLGAFKEIVSAAGNIKDDKRFKDVAGEYRRRAGVMMQSIAVGPRPLEAGPQQAAWDDAANKLGNFAPDIKGNKSWKDYMNTILAFPAGDPASGPFKTTPSILTPGQPTPLPQTVPATPAEAAPASVQNLSDADKQNLQMFLQLIGPTPGTPPTP